MRIVVSLLVVLAVGSVWLSSQVDTLKSKQAEIEQKANALAEVDTRIAAIEQKLGSPFLDPDYQQLLGLLQSYLIDSSKHQELSLQHTQISLSLLLAPNRPAEEKRQLQEKLGQIKQQAMVIDNTRQKTFQTWQEGMERYEAKIAAQQQGGAAPAGFERRVLEATERMKALKDDMPPASE